MSNPLTTFTSKLLEYGAFSCGLCKEILTTPIRLVEGIGNICQKCYKKKTAENPDWLSGLQCMENTCIELILNELQLPCKYKNQGCSQIIGYRCLTTHEVICPYSPVTCPLNDVEPCSWTGCQLNAIGHFRESHDMHIMDTDGFFKIETDLKDFKMLKCLHNDMQYFFLKLWIENNKMKYFLCSAEEETGLVEFRVRHTSDNGRNAVETKGSVSGAQAFYCEHIVPDLIELDVNAVKAVLGCDDTIVNTFEIVEKTASLGIRENFDRCLECPVCSNLMSSPIQLCQSGHSICSSCGPKLLNCPTCREPLRRSRNYALEDVISRIQYPCRNFGCTEKMLLMEIDEHEASCIYKRYKCPVISCSAKINFYTIKTHVKNDHGDIIESNIYRKSFNIVKDKFHEIHHFLAYSQIFRMTFNRTNNSLFFDVEMLGKHGEDPKGYQFKILKDGTNDSLWSQRCSSDTKESTSDDFFKKCSKFENYYLQLHAKNDVFSFACKIIRRKSANASLTEVI